MQLPGPAPKLLRVERILAARDEGVKARRRSQTLQPCPGTWGKHVKCSTSGSWQGKAARPTPKGFLCGLTESVSLVGSWQSVLTRLPISPFKAHDYATEHLERLQAF